MSRNTDITRRNAIRTIAGATGVAGLASAAEAAPDEQVEVNVGFANAAGRRAARREADEVVREFDFDALTARMPARAVDALSANPNVRYVEENGEMQALAQDVPYGVSQVNADDAIGPGETGSGVDVAVIDTGIDANHDDLEADLGAGAYAVACQGTDCVTSWDDGHGTHCAGTVGAVDNSIDVVGVAPDVTLHAVKVLGARGSGSYSDIAAGIEYTANKGWDVGSLSLGGGFSSAVADACRYAYDDGVLLIAAAGNSGPCTDCVATRRHSTSVSPCRRWTPART